MIIGHGIDIVDLRRFEKMDETRLNRLANRICTNFELSEFKTHKYANRYLAEIWASKEAISKAFGTGIQGKVSWKNMQILNNNIGKPQVYFKDDLAGPRCFLSISHEKDFLIASAILEIYD